MLIIKCNQGTPEWHNARRCRVTGTKLEMVMGTPLARVQLISELIAEEMTEQSEVFRPTAKMERGSEKEPVAVEAFEKQCGKKINRDVGFMVSDEFDWLGFSPDGVIGDDYSEMVECKNPDTKTMMFYKIANMIPKETTGLPAGKQTWLGVPIDYKYQVICGFLVNEKCKRIHFLVHDDRILDEKQRLYVVVVDRDNELMQKAINETKEELIKFRADWLNWKAIIAPDNF